MWHIQRISVLLLCFVGILVCSQTTCPNPDFYQLSHGLEKGGEFDNSQEETVAVKTDASGALYFLIMFTSLVMFGKKGTILG
jgi:hypothetical protein